MAIVSCVFIHQFIKKCMQGRPGVESQTQYDLLGLNSERPV